MNDKINLPQITLSCKPTRCPRMPHVHPFWRRSQPKTSSLTVSDGFLNHRRDSDTRQQSTSRWFKLGAILVILCLSLIPLSCSRVPEVPDFIKDTFQPEMIVPVFDPDAHIMPQTGTVGYVKNGVKAMAVPLNDVKAVDAFGIFIYNGTDHWISFKKKDCQMLDGTGSVTKPIDKSQESFYLKKNFRPKLPPEFGAEVFRWDKAIRIQGDPAILPREDIEKTTVMPGQHARFFLYFRKRSIKYSSLRIIVPRVTSDFNEQQTTFVFKFRVQRG